MSESAMKTMPATLTGRAAVLEGLPEHPALKAILGWNAEALVDALYDRSELTLTIAPAEICGAAQAVRDGGYAFFEDMTAVDWYPAEPRFQLSYHILSYTYKEHIRLRALVHEPAIDSITPVWPSANYYEREVFDLFGIRFEGHPNLRRIMLPDEFQGHPLRKDYPVEGYR